MAALAGRSQRLTAFSRVQFNVNWQWPAIRMQYERLLERSRLPPERIFAEHMQTIADMDLLVTAVRRLLRTAEFARQIRSGHQEQLKQALSIFNSKWGNLTAVRNALEHVDNMTIGFPLPVVGFPAPRLGGGNFTFAWPGGGNLDLGKLYADAQRIVRAIVSVIQSAEADPGKAVTPSAPEMA
jgi:hypothetical protein